MYTGASGSSRLPSQERRRGKAGGKFHHQGFRLSDCIRNEHDITWTFLVALTGTLLR
jgi:hypothetical protein